MTRGSNTETRSSSLKRSNLWSEVKISTMENNMINSFVLTSKNHTSRKLWMIVLLFLMKTMLTEATFSVKTNGTNIVINNGKNVNPSFRYGIAATTLVGTSDVELDWISQTGSSVPYNLVINYNTTLLSLIVDVPNSGLITTSETSFTVSFSCGQTRSANTPVEFNIITNGNSVAMIYFLFACYDPVCTIDADCHYPNGTCNSGNCICVNNGTHVYTGYDCRWGISTPESVCIGQNYNMSWAAPEEEYSSDGDDVILYIGPETGADYDMIYIPQNWIENCNTNRFYMYPYDKMWDKRTYTNPQPTPYGVFNYTESIPGTFYWIFVKDNGCDYQLVKKIVVLPNTDPRCAAQITPQPPAGKCPNDCSGHGNCTNVNGTYGCVCDTPQWYGTDCSTGCSSQQVVLTEYSGDLVDGSGPIYRYNTPITCRWRIEPAYTITSINLRLNQVWVYTDLVSFTYYDYTINQTKTVSFDGSPSLPPCVDAQLMTNTYVNVTFNSLYAYIGFGWNISYFSSGCPIGKFVNGSVCTDCPQYYYTIVEDSAYCLPCPAGKFNYGNFTAECFNCPADTYNEVPGPCLECPENTKTDLEGAGNKSLCLCVPGFYSPGGIAGNPCIPCPDGAICDGKTTPPKAKIKYWNSAEDPYKFYKCSSINACPGNGTQICGEGFGGPICSTCLPGYYMRLGDCNECSGNSVSWLPIACIALLILSAIIYKAVNRKDFLRINTLLSISTAFGLLVAFLQIVVVYQDFKIDWPPFITDFFNILSILNFNVDLAAPECSISSMTEYSRYILKIFLPLLLIVSFAILHGISWIQVQMATKFGTAFKLKFHNFCKVPDDKTKKLSFAKVRYWFSELFTLPQPMNVNFTINALVMLFDLIYIYICQVTFEIFNCYPQTDGTHSLFSNPETRCYQGDWWKYLPFTIISIILFILSFPALLVYVVYYGPHRQDNKVFMQRFNQLFYRFQPSKYWWEMVIIARKLFITFVILIVSSNPVIQTTLAIAFVVTALFLHIYHWPYWVNESNWLETVLLTVNLGILCIALLFIGDDPKSSFGDSESLFNFYSGLVLAFVAIGFGAAVLVTAWALFRFCFPVKEKVVSSEQEVVVGIWKNLTAQNSKADFDAVWKHLPREEQEMAILTAEAFGYEALGQKGTKIRRVSPTRLHYEEKLRKRRAANNDTEEDYNEEDLIQLPSLEKVVIKVDDNSRSPLTTDSDNNNVNNSVASMESSPSSTPKSPRRGRSTTRKDNRKPSVSKKSKSGSRTSRIDRDKDREESKPKSKSRERGDSKRDSRRLEKKKRESKSLEKNNGAGNSSNNDSISSFNTDSKKTEDNQYTFGHYQIEKASNENGNTNDVEVDEKSFGSERDREINLEKEVSSSNVKTFNSATTVDTTNTNSNENNDNKNINNNDKTKEFHKIVGVESGASGPIMTKPKKKKERNTKPLKSPKEREEEKRKQRREKSDSSLNETSSSSSSSEGSSESSSESD